ncbi:alpha-ketoglutarate-dependent dioxygenase AlkB [Lewinella sp. W8]|uniref:alpha-ketoglutarate-dependent dioxygenase AlkB n=1 Tax=Lewinella sp. W8 TaxID=2528208 RepID=UPI001067A827|nr:alpha-ketoglutarate-dependent dioxygenase AlkB [Lewinella sp. W8]MTB51325.1 2OG-Fe(II) oxygenase [Lewinella sp. W8]
MFDKVPLDDHHFILRSSFPQSFGGGINDFSHLWDLRPEEFHRVVMAGKEVPLPRWQQAYGYNYRYTGSVNKSLPIPKKLHPFLRFCHEHVDKRLNGLLLNWYDGKQGHYIGKHRDSTIGLLPQSPIVTISLGEERVFRLRPYRGTGSVDLPVANGDVVIIPWNTNLSWTHEVPKLKKYQGKRISVTLRAFV